MPWYALITSVHIKLYQATPPWTPKYQAGYTWIHQASQRSLRRQNHGLSTFAAFATQNDRILTSEFHALLLLFSSYGAKARVECNRIFSEWIFHIFDPKPMLTTTKQAWDCRWRQAHILTQITFQNMPYITSKTTTNICQHLFRLPAVLLVEASWANCLDWSTLASSV